MPRARGRTSGHADRRRSRARLSRFSNYLCARIPHHSCAAISCERGIIRNEELRTRRSGERVTVSGLVTIRQQPGTASGVIFMTIEDESAIANIIVWPKTFERFRAIVMGARYIAVAGELQQESGVIHVVANRLDDLTPLLARLTERHHRSKSLARADAVKRPHDENVDSRARGRRNPPRIAAPGGTAGFAGERPRRSRTRLRTCPRAARGTRI